MSGHASASECLFCKIVAGEIPCYRVYEDNHVLAFLDIGPLSRGHTLIIPKTHAVTLDQLEDEVAAACGAAARKVGAAVARATGCAGWNLLQNNGALAGQVVMHVHFHVIPRTEGDGLGYRWPAGELDDQTASHLKSAITAELGPLAIARDP
jgi:histidine triad (HIT) family protein